MFQDKGDKDLVEGLWFIRKVEDVCELEREIGDALWGNDIFAPVVKPQGLSLNDARTKALVCLAWKGLGYIGCVHPFQMRQFRQAPRLDLFFSRLFRVLRGSYHILRYLEAASCFICFLPERSSRNGHRRKGVGNQCVD